MDIFTISTSTVIPYGLRSIEDPFAKELIELWHTRNMSGSIYTASLYNKPVGFCLVEQKGIGKTATIRGMYMVDSFRGKGIGQLILDLVIHDYGKRDIWVNISDGAEAFYEKKNFQVVGRRRDFPDQLIGYLGKKTPEEQKEIVKNRLS